MMKEQFKRPDLWFFGVFFGWISTWFAFAGGAIPNIIYKLAGDDESTADLYVNYLVPLIGNSSFVFTPLVGVVIHKFGFRISFGITTVLVHLFIGFLNIKSLHVQIITLLWYSLSQAFFYSLQFAYISKSLLFLLPRLSFSVSVELTSVLALFAQQLCASLRKCTAVCSASSRFAHSSWDCSTTRSTHGRRTHCMATTRTSSSCLQLPWCSSTSSWG